MSYLRDRVSEKDEDAQDDDEDEWTSDTSASNSGSGSGSDAADEPTEALATRSLDDSDDLGNSNTTWDPFDPERLAAFFAALPNLTGLGAFGKELAYGLLDDSVGPKKHFPKLEFVSVDVRSDEYFDESEDSHFFLLAQRYPLDLLHVKNADAIPIDEAEFEDEDEPEDWPMTPRSWSLKHLEFQRLAHLSPGAQYLFRALSSLESLHIGAATTEPDFSTYIIHLPPTLVKLCLRIGPIHATPLERSTAPTLAPFLATAATAFPKLQVLDLGGTIVSRELLASLHHLPVLQCLHLSHGASLFLPSLLALFQPGPSRVLNLSHLQIHICHCPAGAKDGLGSETRSRLVPNWQPHAGFGRAEAKKLVRAGANAIGMDGKRLRVNGAILCALQQCGRGEDGHACERDGGGDDDDSD